MKKAHPKSIGILAIIGFLGLIMGFLLIPVSKSNAQLALVSVAITVSPGTVCVGQSSTLNWSSTNATTITISPSVAAAPLTPFGTASVSPSVTTIYTITGNNSTGASGTAQATVNVSGPCSGGVNPTVSLTANPTSINFNGTSILTWSSTNATSCSASGGTNGWGGVIALSGTFNTGALTNTTTYSIVCTNSTGSATAATTVSVGGGGGGTGPLVFNPSVFLNADSNNVAFNDSTILRWSSSNANTCNASNGANGWGGFVATSGFFFTGPLTNTTTYNIFCSNSTGTANAAVTVFVNGFQNIIQSFPPVNIVNSQPSTGTINSSTTIIRQAVARTTPTSLVLINSSVDRNQPIVPTLDNTRPHPGDEINYTVNYQNIGTGAITGLNLQIVLPQEVDYLFSNPNNPGIFGNTLIFRLGTLRANGQGVVTVRVRVRDNIPPGTNLNFPATLSYIDPSGAPQSVFANVSAQISGEPANAGGSIPLGANIFGAGLFPENIFGWLILIILIFVMILLLRHPRIKFLNNKPENKQV